ncbi:MAG TPA: hypothetical protein VNJ08_14620 [Bacteriovoracaceae bacterium]|nr:hypothetical protein [Bacteriovoracaceae bacterium]
MRLLIIALMVSVMPTAFAELYDSPNHPSNFRRLMGTSLVLDFAGLPLTGKIADDRTGWSETYWPSNKGGIAYRWNSPDPQPFKYKLNTLEDLKKMSPNELATLSPAELYDIANDDYNYTLTKYVFSRFKPNDLWWEGICHGWAQAATHYPEPAPVKVVNQSGISLVFGSSDVKGLLAMHEAYNFKSEKPYVFGFVGKRCRVGGKVPGEGDNRDRNTNPPAEEQAESPDCRDVNAGSFHVVLANMIGIMGKGFVADIDRYNDVWNQPIVAYTSEVVGEEAVDGVQRSVGIERRVRIKTVFHFGEELKYYTPELYAEGHRNFVSKLPVTNTIHQKVLVKNYEYIIEMNAAGKIIGGEWISITRPDFMWNYSKSKHFQNSPVPLANLGKIYRPVRR